MDKQKDFVKGWGEYKAKKKQEVEELGRDIADICSDMALNCCGNTPCYACIAKRLERKGYRKIPENAVVLTEERNKIICDRFEQLERVQAELQELNAKYYNETKDLRRELKRVRKETAEKFAEKLEEVLVNYVPQRLIDEICKEIGGGNG